MGCWILNQRNQRSSSITYCIKNLYNKVQSALFNDNYVSGEFGSKLDDILNSSERLNEKLVVINSNVSTKKGTEGNGNIDTGAQY